MKDNYPNASEEQLELKRQRLLATLSAAECRWLAEWSVAMMGLYSDSNAWRFVKSPGSAMPFTGMGSFAGLLKYVRGSSSENDRDLAVVPASRPDGDFNVLAECD